jgi:hypothetical protein
MVMYADEEMYSLDPKGKEEAEDIVVDYLMGEKELEKLIHHFTLTADDAPLYLAHGEEVSDHQ